jgi:hypothetical protein
MMVLVLMLSLALALGCGAGGLIGGGDETPPAAEAPAEAGGREQGTEEEPAPEAGEAEESISLSSVTGGLQNLDSYRSFLTMSFDGTTEGSADQWTIEMEIEHVRDPFAQRFVMRGGAMSGTTLGEGLESVQIGDQQYVVFGEGQCLSSSAAEGDVMDTEIFKPDDMLGGLSNARRVRPDERINGILCRHYTFDEKSLLLGDISRAEGEMWVAVDGDYVVKYVLEAEGKDPTSGDEGRIEWVYELRDVNAPITIEPPAGCQAAGSEFPIMADAADVTTMSGMVTYKSSSSFNDVLAFYQAEMKAAGWAESGDSFTSEDMAMLTYTKDGRTASVMLTSEEGKVSVFITSE